MSHNPDRPSYKTATSEEYAAFYSRLEEAFEPIDMKREDLAKWLNNDSLADTFSLTREVFIQIEDAETIAELREIQKEARLLTIHKNKLLNRIDERIEDIKISLEEQKITRAITLTQNFAKEKGVTLSEKTKGGVYENWGRYHKPAVVIFKDGKIKNWKYIK